MILSLIYYVLLSDLERIIELPFPDSGGPPCPTRFIDKISPITMILMEDGT